ncbi:ABC transporter ATP-binding protein [Thiomonas intermedia]|uniref:ABC transporter ATP-binding protein n=1 Tax=Thiomonas intermedia TaxID=926 RepID=UPI0009A54E04|nr:ABC transporter ATP-binding protein [Thiomonas intermedia]
MATLEIKEVAKRYGDRTVLHDISLDLTSGEFVSLLGPSGCGKTTLLRIIAGFEQPDRGRVVVGGRDITALPANQRQMGMVFQAYSLFPNMSAADNVRFGLRVRKIGAAEQTRRIGDMLELVGLSAHADKYPHQLSGGQQQRVALARALAIQPTLLLLDEPLSALDAKVRVQLREEIRRIQRETGITTVFVTHDQEEALSISDRVAVMFEGRMVQVGAPAAIYQEPTHPFVAQFIGISSRLPARVVDADQGVISVLDRPLHTPRARGLQPDSALHLYLRPEGVQLQAVDGNAPQGAVLQGTVRESTFFGAITRLRVEVDGGQRVLADLSTHEALKLPIGSRVHVGWQLDAMRLLPAELPA